IACGNALVAYAAAFYGRAFAKDVRCAGVPHAAQVAQLAQIEFVAGRVVNARDAQPLYLRNKVALTTVERLAKVAA
ncbi:MAG: tRNA (adenosine(37)-N6)-threonylcarbamoyltransferase complex dimerization subunit type 1 TsaB, partial [Noviherbaspirillum sp.]